MTDPFWSGVLLAASALNLLIGAALIWCSREVARRDAAIRRRESAMRFMERCDSAMLEETRRRGKARLN